MPEWTSGFPYFFQFKSEFGNKDLWSEPQWTPGLIFADCIEFCLEKDMATHSSVLACEIPGTGEPGGLPSMGSHRVSHDWSDLAAEFCHLWLQWISIWFWYWSTSRSSGDEFTLFLFVWERHCLFLWKDYCFWVKYSQFKYFSFRTFNILCPFSWTAMFCRKISWEYYGGSLIYDKELLYCCFQNSLCSWFW